MSTATKTPQFATAVSKAGGDQKPMGGNVGNAALQAATGGLKRPKAVASIYVDQETWEAQTQGSEERYQHYAAGLAAVHQDALTRADDARLALVLVAARLYLERPGDFQKKNGTFNASALARALGVYGTAKFRTAISRGVPALVEGGAEVYGEPSPEVVALALAHRRVEVAQDKASRASKASESDAGAAGDGAPGESAPESPESVDTVGRLAASLQDARKLLGSLTDEELDDDRMGDVYALITELHDTIA